MQIGILAAAAALLAPAVAAAQTAPGGLPRAFAGYGQPAITPAMCKVVSASEARCVVPAMTAGRYLIEAAGTSTAQGADARQGLEIAVGGMGCGIAQPTNPPPWTSGLRTFRVDCEAILLTDTPLVVRVIYVDFHATKDPRGPTLSLKPLPWLGVTSARMFAPEPPPAAPSAPTGKK
ncbi:MAG TPA: hypothetical protein VFC47_13925 [Caulobacteraceae bacterium]|nr:hypothetical protein [Caulobacteraceae bacterium]